MRLSLAMRAALASIASLSVGRGRRGMRKVDVQACFEPRTITALRNRKLIATRRLNVGVKSTPVTFFTATDLGFEALL